MILLFGIALCRLYHVPFSSTHSKEISLSFSYSHFCHFIYSDPSFVGDNQELDVSLLDAELSKKGE